MRLDDRTCNRQPEPGPAGLPAARGLDAIERLKHGRALERGDARAVVVDKDGDLGGRTLDRDLGRPPEAKRVVEEVCKQPAQGADLAHDGDDGGEPHERPQRFNGKARRRAPDARADFAAALEHDVAPRREADRHLQRLARGEPVLAEAQLPRP